MSNPVPSNSRDSDRKTTLSNVALLYYGEGLTQSEIAKRMQVSRVTVVNMLRDARELGVVEIHVDGQKLKEDSLSRGLREKFKLEDVYVADTFQSDGAARSDTLRQVGRVASSAFLDIVEKGDRIGVAWGETVMAMSDAMPRAKIDKVSVNQLIGSMISERVPASESCAIQIASKIGASCHTLHAPALVASADIADIFRSEPTIGAQLSSLKNLDLVLYSIGHVGADTHLAAADMVTPAELKSAVSRGATGIICCRYIDAQGQPCAAQPEERLIAASIDDLKSAKKRLLVVCGGDRLDATLAAIKGGLVTHLCVDRSLGNDLAAH